MAFFSRSRFRSRPRRRMAMGGFRRPRLRDPQRQKGLEVANFYFTDTVQIANVSDDVLSIYTSLATLPLIFGNDSSTPENRVGIALQSMQRYIQLSGIVYDYGIQQFYMNGGSDPELATMLFCHQLFTDRMEYSSTDVAFPATIGSYDPFVNDFPVSNLTATSPEFTQRQGVQPTRIHHTFTRNIYTSPGIILNDSEGTLYFAQGQEVRQRNGTVNRRLRIRLDDNHGLFFGWFFKTPPGFAQPSQPSRFFRRWARGQIYYRFRQ